MGGNNQVNNTLDLGNHQWKSYIEPILELGREVLTMWPETDSDDQLRQDLFKFMFSEIGAGFMQLAYANDHHPDFIPVWSQLFNNGGCINPDGVYYLSPIDDQGIYRISGVRGTTRIVDLQLADGSVFAQGRMNEQQNFGKTLANYDLDHDLRLQNDGTFDVIVSAEKPDGYSGDWWKLPAETNYILVRQFAYDWTTEIDARVAIERLDTPAAKTRPDAEQIKSMLDRVPEFIFSSLKTLEVSLHANPGLGSPGLINNVMNVDFSSDQGGRAAQWYVVGRFDLAEEEALLIELDPGVSRYWNLQLANELSNTLDFMNRSVCTNGFQAEPDSDGVYRIVISHQDPHVPNWLDTVGHRKGIIWGRMDGCENDSAPTATLINLEKVSDYFPQGTSTVTAEEREKCIRQRRKGAQMRRRW